MNTAALVAYLEKEFEGHYTLQTYKSVVPTTPERILSNSMERMAYVLVNLGGSPIVLSLGKPALPYEGILISPSGGAFITDCTNDLVVPGIELYAWCPTGSSNVVIFSVERYQVA